MLKRTLLALCLCLPASAGWAETPRLPRQVRLAEVEAKLAEIDAGRLAEAKAFDKGQASKNCSEILVQAETKAWRRYVDGECGRRSLSSGQPLPDCRLELTEARIEELKEWEFATGEPCFEDGSWVVQTRCFADRRKKVEDRLAKAEAARRTDAKETDGFMLETGRPGYAVAVRAAKASAKAWKAYVAAECAYRVADLTTGVLADVVEEECPAELHEQRIRELGGE